MVKANKNLPSETSDLIDSVLSIPANHLRGLLARHDLTMPNTKADLRNSLRSAVADGILDKDAIQKFLDAKLLSGRQHVYLYNGPDDGLTEVQSKTSLRKHLKKHNREDLLDAEIPVRLGAKAELVSVRLVRSRYLTVLSGRQREYFQHEGSLDKTGTEKGLHVEYRAFVRYVARSLYALVWDNTTSNISVHIPQLPGKTDYEKERDSFLESVLDIFPGMHLSLVKLEKVIKKLHTLEEQRKAETRSYRRAYAATSGRLLTARSASRRDPVQGDSIIDGAMTQMRGAGAGHRNKCSWLPEGKSAHKSCKIKSEIGTDILARHNRINFSAFSDAEDIQYVLSRIRRFASK